MSDDITLTTPGWGDVLPFYGGDWKEALPDAPTPFYATTSIGWFMHRRIPMGRGFIPAHNVPPRLATPENKYGEFHFEAPKLPKEIVAQAVDFFTRVYDAHKTEAAVHIVQHAETKEYRLFVPHQRLSGGGVYSIFNPAHIHRDYLHIGTIHSHCNFGAYHSGTDEADAREMDGLHITIGHLKRDPKEGGIQIEAMVSMNKVLFKYEGNWEDGTPKINSLLDSSDPHCATAPAWWDRYLIFGVITDADRERIAPYADDKAWDRFMGRTKQYGLPQQQPTKPLVNAPSWWPKRQQEPETWTEVSHEFMESKGYLWDENMNTYRWVGHEKVAEAKKQEVTPEDQLLAFMDEELGSDFVNMLLKSGLMTSDVLKKAFVDGKVAGTETYWQNEILSTFVASAKLLREMGFAIEFSQLEEPAPPQTILPDLFDNEDDVILLPEPKKKLSRAEKRRAKREGVIYQ